jgi:hypothetical protein
MRLSITKARDFSVPFELTGSGYSMLNCRKFGYNLSHRPLVRVYSLCKDSRRKCVNLLSRSFAATLQSSVDENGSWAAQASVGELFESLHNKTIC